MASQSRSKGKPNPRPKTQHRGETPALQPDLPIKTPPEQNLPRQGTTDEGANPNPTHKEGPTTENQKVLETLLSIHHYIPPVLETKGEGEGGGTTERGEESGPSTERAHERKQPLLQEENPDQSEDKPINLLVFFQLSQGRIEELTSLLSEMSGTPLTMEMTCKWLDLEPQIKEISHDSRTKKLIDGLTEDPEDHPDGLISILELHNARLKKAHLLHEATSDIIQQKWIEGTDLEDIGKFLQSWAPEPYRNKLMPKGMTQALLDIAPNSQAWAPTDSSNCIFRNIEATDSFDFPPKNGVTPKLPSEVAQCL